MDIEVAGMSYIVSRNSTETDKDYLSRKWYVAKKSPKTKDDYQRTIQLSNVYLNAQKGCRYNEELMAEV